MKYSEVSLDIIGNSKVLSQEDWDSLANLKDELKDTFLYSQMFRTRTEMEVSILNDIKHPTPDSKYWQSVREQNVMFHELVMLSYDYRKNLIEIKQLERKLGTETDNLEKELLQIEIERKKFISLNQEKIAKDRIREIRQWHEIKANLIPQMKHGLKDVDEHQLVSYTQRWIKQSMQLNANTGIAERNNLIGQLASGLKACEEKGLLDKVFSIFDEPTKEYTLKNYKQYLLEK